MSYPKISKYSKISHILCALLSMPLNLAKFIALIKLNILHQSKILIIYQDK
jgi:hypothetical protein